MSAYSTVHKPPVARRRRSRCSDCLDHAPLQRNMPAVLRMQADIACLFSGWIFGGSLFSTWKNDPRNVYRNASKTVVR